MNSEKHGSGLKFLRLVLFLGGGYEICMGLVMIFFIRTFFGMLGAGVELGPLIFPRTAGTLAIFFGVLLAASGRDPERYLLIPVVSMALRLAIQVPILAGIFEVPSLTLPLIAFGVGDLLFAAVTALALHRAGLWRAKS